jgi:O-antigen/teichoic acid export membrane protein
MRQSHLIFSNTIIIWVARVFLLVPQLIMVPFLIHRIGDVGYGVYALTWSLMISIEQLQISLQSGVVKYSAGFLAQGRMDEVNKVVSSSFVYSLLLAAVGCTGTLVAAAFYEDPSGQIGTALAVVGVMILFIFPLTPYIAVIQSRQRYYVGAIAETISKYVGLLVLIVWFHTMGPSIEALIIIMAGMLFLSKLAQVPFAYRMVPGLHNRPSLFDWRSFRLIVSFGGVIVLFSLCLTANSTGVRWMMGILVSPSFVAHLAIILMPGLLISQIVLALTATVMAATSAYEATRNQRMLQELLIRGMRYTTILVLAGIIAAGLLMRNVLSIWVGPEYEFLAPYALVLFASISFSLSTSTSHHMLKGLGKLRGTVFISMMGLVIVPIGLILAVFFIWHDPYAATTAGLAAGMIVYGYLQIVFGSKAVDADLRRVLIRVYAQPLMVAAPVCLLALGIVTIIGIDGLVGRSCVSLLAVLLLFIACYLLIATEAEQQQIKELRQLILNRLLAMRETLVVRR